MAITIQEVFEWNIRTSWWNAQILKEGGKITGAATITQEMMEDVHSYVEKIDSETSRKVPVEEAMKHILKDVREQVILNAADIHPRGRAVFTRLHSHDLFELDETKIILNERGSLVIERAVSTAARSDIVYSGNLLEYVCDLLSGKPFRHFVTEYGTDNLEKFLLKGKKGKDIWSDYILLDLCLEKDFPEGPELV